MSKTSPIVIPVTVDTTGVDRGLNNVRNRLSRGGGRGTSGGFGTGGNNSGGVGHSGSGGGALSAAIAGAVAGRAASRGAAGMGTFGGRTAFHAPALIGKGVYRDFGPPPDEAELRAAMRFKRTNQQARQALADLNEDISIYGATGQTEKIAASRSRYERILQARELRETRLRSLLSANMNFQRPRIAGSEFGKQMLGRFGVPEGLAKKLGPALGMLGGLGVGAGIGMKAADYYQNMAGRFGDLSRFEGTSYYSTARRLRSRYLDKSKAIGFMDRFYLGEEMGGGGGSSIINRMGDWVREFSENIGFVAGGGMVNQPYGVGNKTLFEGMGRLGRDIVKDVKVRMAN